MRTYKFRMIKLYIWKLTGLHLHSNCQAELFMYGLSTRRQAKRKSHALDCFYRARKKIVLQASDLIISGMGLPWPGAVSEFCSDPISASPRPLFSLSTESKENLDFWEGTIFSLT